MRYLMMIGIVCILYSCTTPTPVLHTQTNTGNIQNVATGTKVEIPLNEKNTQDEQDFQNDLNNLLNSVDKDGHQ